MWQVCDSCDHNVILTSNPEWKEKQNEKKKIETKMKSIIYDSDNKDNML